jgi:hypothetical protein
LEDVGVDGNINLTSEPQNGLQRLQVLVEEEEGSCL